jgi:uncharacterized protein YgiB involved in biofilm formation
MAQEMKRSKRVVLTTLTIAGVAAVQGCGSGDWGDGPAVEAFPYNSVTECTRAGVLPASECESAYSEAVASHEQTAPRFESRALCEEQFGAAQCQPRQTSQGGVWMPMLTGFMIGRMFDSQNRMGYRHAGLYRSRRDDRWYTGGGAALRSGGGGWQAGASSFDRPTSAPPIHTRSSIASRGGFGTRARGGGG